MRIFTTRILKALFELFVANLPQRKKHLFAVLCIILLGLQTTSGQYLHASGQKILDQNNKEIILRGLGIGGWMIQEGYMLGTNSFANPQHEIRAKITDVIGETNTNRFYEAWLSNLCTARDIDSLAAWGFNSVRLPMHYNLYTLSIQDEPVPNQNTWLDKGFAMTDSLLRWCAKNKMYLILDLHAAPGGQGNDASISDYDISKPSLWQSDANKQKTIALWAKLAERYANEPWIGGYDLINETNWNFTAGANINGCDEISNAPLRQLFVDITNAIRQKDTHHMIFIEGNCWANNHRGLWPAWDSNIAISFHKYWNYNDQGSIQGFIDMRNQYNVPLWLGESGENSNTWFTDAIRLLEKNNIGWSWWPLKKINSLVNPLTVVQTDDYNTLLNYWKNGGTKPTTDFATNALMQQAENLKIENNIYRKDVIDAMFRQVYDRTTKPFKHVTLPGVIQLSDYDLGANGIAYADADTANYQVATGNYAAWNTGYSYRNDGVDIQSSTDGDARSNKLNIGWTVDGEWMQYTVHVDSSAVYSLGLRYATAVTSAAVSIQVNDVNVRGIISLPSTGDYQTWSTQTIDNIVLYKGTQRLRIKIEKGGANLGFADVSLSKKINAISFTALNGHTRGDKKSFVISLNKALQTPTLAGSNFQCSVNGNPVTISSVQGDGTNPVNILVTLNQTIKNGDVITASYSGNNVQASDATMLQAFTRLPITNTLPFYFSIPTKIEAENFTTNNGLQSEACTDTDGGQDMGYTNTGDYLEYAIQVAVDGNYHIALRIACNSQAGKLDLQQLSSDRTILNTTTIDVPVTGGWQNWQTVNAMMKMTAGTGILRVAITQPEFNINWLNFSDVVNGVPDRRQGSIRIYPNPTHKTLTIDLSDEPATLNNELFIRSLNGSLLRHKEYKTSQDINDVFVGDLPKGAYLLELTMNGERWSSKFVVE